LRIGLSCRGSSDVGPAVDNNPFERLTVHRDFAANSP